MQIILDTTLCNGDEASKAAYKIINTYQIIKR